ncbi:MAG TPA: hypothetical protein VII52_01700 [Gemmatimonadaceae bacterium]
MKQAIYATRHNPINELRAGKRIRAWVEPCSLHTNGQPVWGLARHWTIEVNGTAYAGPAFDIFRHNSMEGAVTMLNAWAEDRTDLFPPQPPR